MVHIKGFRAYRYDPALVGDPSNVVTPPYDVISEEERRILHAKDPHNYARLILPEADGDTPPHAVAGRLLDEWVREGVFKQDSDPSFYLLEQTFKGLDGREHVRRAFFAIIRIPEPGENVILGHERTFQRKVEDRLGLAEATRANMGAVFGLYSDPDFTLAPFYAQMDARPSDMFANTIDGVTQKLWVVPEDPAVIDFIGKQKIYLADGHHRFKTAELYRERMRARHPNAGPQSYDYCLMGFVSFDDPGLFIYPPHRVVERPTDFDSERFIHDLEQWFTVRRVEGALVDSVASNNGCSMGLAIAGAGNYLLKLRDIDRTAMLGDDRGPSWRDLDVAILHRGILERMLGFPEGGEHVYEKNAANALAMVERGEKALAFILNGTRQEQIRACAEAGEPMPQKSTYFYPKLPSGAVIYRLV